MFTKGRGRGLVVVDDREDVKLSAVGMMIGRCCCGVIIRADGGEEDGEDDGSGG